MGELNAIVVHLSLQTDGLLCFATSQSVDSYSNIMHMDIAVMHMDTDTYE